MYVKPKQTQIFIAFNNQVKTPLNLAIHYLCHVLGRQQNVEEWRRYV